MVLSVLTSCFQPKRPRIGSSKSHLSAIDVNRTPSLEFDARDSKNAAKFYDSCRLHQEPFNSVWRHKGLLRDLLSHHDFHVEIPCDKFGTAKGKHRSQTKILDMAFQYGSCDSVHSILAHPTYHRNPVKDFLLSRRTNTGACLAVMQDQRAILWTKGWNVSGSDENFNGADAISLFCHPDYNQNGAMLLQFVDFIFQRIWLDMLIHFEKLNRSLDHLKLPGHVQRQIAVTAMPDITNWCRPDLNHVNTNAKSYAGSDMSRKCASPSRKDIRLAGMIHAKLLALQKRFNDRFVDDGSEGNQWIHQTQPSRSKCKSKSKSTCLPNEVISS